MLSGDGPSNFPSFFGGLTLLQKKNQYQLTAVAGASMVRNGKLKPEEWVGSCLDRIASIDSIVHAWSYIDPEMILRSLDSLKGEDWSNRTPSASLAGVPIGVKDCFNTADMPTAMGSDLWRGFNPGNDARVVASARLLGAIPLGKTVTAEFATHAPGETVNPHAAGAISGTSSSGSAAAVACGMVPVALGTQTGGSITRPASYMGVVGFKPSFGIIPRTGVLKTADTLDTIGWFSRNVSDSRLLLDCLRVKGRDYPVIEEGFVNAAIGRNENKALRIALVEPPSWKDAASYARDQLIEYVNQLGNRLDVDCGYLNLQESLGECHEVHRQIYHTQLAYYFERELENPQKVSDTFREITAEGQSVSMEEYVAALDKQRQFEHHLKGLLDGYDVALTLSVAGEAPQLSNPYEPDDSSLVWTLCGAPTITLPVLSGPNGLPFGVQMFAPRYGDYLLLDAAESIFPDTVDVVDPSGYMTSS